MFFDENIQTLSSYFEIYATLLLMVATLLSNRTTKFTPVLLFHCSCWLMCHPPLLPSPASGNHYPILNFYDINFF
jgi:hypothetical protein